MSNFTRNALALFGGLIIGGAVNMGIISVGPSLIPPPAGADLTTAEGLKAAMHLLEPRHFLVPFLAHAIGTFVGALTAFLIASREARRLAYIIGFLFLCGGVAAAFMIPAPAWFIALDLLVAYLPMSWLAIQAGRQIKGNNAANTR